MSSDVFKMRGQVTIKLIDKRTGSEVFNESYENDIDSGLCLAISSQLAGVAGPALGPIKYAYLYNAAGALLKTLDETYRTVLERIAEASDYKVHVVFRDATTDAYTVGRVELRMVDAAGFETRVVVKSGLNVAKTADKVLVVDWNIVFPFTA